MKYLELPIEKIVKYDESDMASIECPVCDHRNFTVIFGKTGRTSLFCRNDEFSLTKTSNLTTYTDYSVYENLSDSYMAKQIKELNILFKKGLITYITLIEVAVHGIFKND